MSSFQDKIIDYYGFSKEEVNDLFREPSFSYLPTLEDEEQAIIAKLRIKQAIKNKEKILIYGDYDCDGIMSSSIIFKSIISLGGSSSIFIPSRYIDGYGINTENATKISKAGYKLVILVDNGISANEQVKVLTDAKIDVIIIDHHENNGDLPQNCIIIHPLTTKYKDLKYNVSAGYLSFMFSTMLLEKVDDYLLTLGGLSTLSDLMTLKEYNREIVRLALKNLNLYKYKEIMYLTSKTFIDENVLNSEVIPCINSIGRMDLEHKIRVLVYYFASSSESEKQKYSSWMKKNNDERKEITKIAYDKVILDPFEPGICIISSLIEGLNGILSNRLMTENNKATIVFSPSKIDPEILVGSMRSKKSFSCFIAFDKLSHYILRSGGHELAAGISIKKSDYPYFREEFMELCKKYPLDDEEKNYLDLSMNELTSSSYHTLRKFGPFGFGYKEPTFRIVDMPISYLRFSKDEKYVLTYLDNDVRLFSFSLGKRELINKQAETFIVKFTLNEYRGKFTIDILLSR